jgi:hypothetical protein
VKKATPWSPNRTVISISLRREVVYEPKCDLPFLNGRENYEKN